MTLLHLRIETVDLELRDGATVHSDNLTEWGNSDICILAVNPSETARFLVTKEQYERGIDFMASLSGKEDSYLKTLDGDVVKFKKQAPLDPALYPDSSYKTLICEKRIEDANGGR